METTPTQDYGEGRETLRPIDELLEKSRDSKAYPNLIEDYHRLIDKDIHLAELYRLAATSQDDRLIPNPVQAVRGVDGELWVDVLVEIEESAALKQLHEIMQVHAYTRRYVSGRILVKRLPELNRQVRRMQVARPIRPAVYNSIPSIQADQQSLGQKLHLQGGDPPPTGSGVIVGIVDIGCDFVHPNFRDQNDDTRLLFLWDQRGGAVGTNGVPYGREFDSKKINQALATSTPYDFLGYEPEDGAHGTHVMDIAAGNSTRYPGVAPGADLIFVHLGLPSPIDVEEETLGSSKYLYDAVKYIFDKADEQGKPAVVNLSLASNGGAHDGTSMVETMFDDLLGAKDGRAIVVAAGNSYVDDIHTMGTVTPGAQAEIEWFIQSHAKVTWEQRQEMEIWYESEADFQVEILDPNGKRLGSCPLGEIRYAQEEDAEEPIMVIGHHFDPVADEKHINVFIDDRYPGLLLGAYRFRLSCGSAHTTDNGEFHAWIERNDAYPSHFTPRSSQTAFTINSIGNANLPIVVGAYNTRLSGMPIAYFSSAGPSRNQNASPKPDISAPGVNIFAARALHSELDDGIVKSGTSMAAPHVTGLIALLFQAASKLRTPPMVLGMDQIRQILTSMADRNPPQASAGVHDPRYGFGRVNGVNALNQVLP
jgi:subtilisin family serine protease